MEVIVLATVYFDSAQAPDWAAVLKQNHETIASVPGYVATTLWAQAGATDSRMLMWRYSSFEAADEGLKRIAEADSYAQSADRMVIPPDVHRLQVLSHRGRMPDQVAVGQFVSICSRMADPGRAEEMVSELEMILEGLYAFDGILGIAIGQDESTSENVVGFATWSHTSGYDDSVPLGAIYQPILYRREA